MGEIKRESPLGPVHETIVGHGNEFKAKDRNFTALDLVSKRVRIKKEG